MKKKELMKYTKYFFALACCVLCSCSDTETIGGLDDEYFRPSGDPSVVVVENLFDTEFATKTAELYTQHQTVEGEVRTLNGQDVVKSDGFKCNLDLNVRFSMPTFVYLSDSTLLAKVEKKNDYSGETSQKQVESGNFVKDKFSKRYSFTFSPDEVISAEAVYEKAALRGHELSYTSIKEIKWYEGKSTLNNELSKADSTVYNVVQKFEVILLRNEKSGQKTEEKHTVEVPYKRVYKAGNTKTGVYVEQTKREIISPTTERLTVTTYENWSSSGKVNRLTETIDLPIVFKEPALQWIYATSSAFTTATGSFSYKNDSTETDKGHWKIKTKPFTYSSTASNSQSNAEQKQFQNVYTGSSCAVVYTRDTLKVTFDYGTWTVKDEKSSISGPQRVDHDQKAYNGYNYVNSVTWTYSILTKADASAKQEISGNARSQAMILLDIPKNIPQDWGVVKSLGITAVPADDVYNGKYDKKAFCLVTANGAVAVVVDKNTDLPAVSDFTSAYFVKGSFDNSYNSSFFTKEKNRHGLDLGKWAPAVGKDEKGGIAYYYQGSKVVVVKGADLHIWHWRGGNYSMRIDGYKVKVEHNVLTITSPSGKELNLH